MGTISSPGKIASLADLMSTPEGEYERWTTEIGYAERELSKFCEKGRKVIRRWLDERDAVNAGEKRFNIFYSNVNIMKSALYSKTPKPDVSRRWKDSQDDVARVAGIMLQRAIAADLDDPDDYFDAAMRGAVEDRLLPGLATCWLRLDTNVEEQTLAADEDNELEEVKYNQVTDQQVIVEHVHWEDFLWSPCRCWAERRWVGRRVYMDRDALKKRFGDEVGNTIPLDYAPQDKLVVDSNAPKNDALQKAVIYELWDREKREVVWLSKAHKSLLDKRPDPLGLKGFEPCPTPMMANLTTSNCVPKPDYYFMQDQYNELDEVNDRLSMLVKACKVVGVYNQAATGIQRMLQEGVDNTLIPVDNWAMFAETGGVAGHISWLPLEQVVNAIQKLRESREDVKQQIYELTGISDIVRGATKASETLGAQQIKAQFASVRIQSLQSEVANFAADILRIKAEIMVKHFTPEMLVRVSGIELTDDAQMVPQAIELLQSPQDFEWRIEVTSDSLAQIDYSQEKQERMEFLTAMSQFLEKSFMMAQAMPQTAPLLLGLLKFGVAGFRGAKEVEGMIDRHLDEMLAQQNSGQQQEEPDPEAEKMKAELEMKREEMGMKRQERQENMGFKRQENQLKLQSKQQESALNMQTKQRQAEQEAMMDQNRMMRELAEPVIRPQGGGDGRA